MGSSARDLRYGRRGGGWVDATGDPLIDIDRIRTRTIDAHERNPKKNPPWPEHATRWRPATPGEWDGRARMAAARTAAGVPLDTIDRQALTRTGAGR